MLDPAHSIFLELAAHEPLHFSALLDNPLEGRERGFEAYLDPNISHGQSTLCKSPNPSSPLSQRASSLRVCHVSADAASDVAIYGDYTSTRPTRNSAILQAFWASHHLRFGLTFPALLGVTALASLPPAINAGNYFRRIDFPLSLPLTTTQRLSQWKEAIDALGIITLLSTPPHLEPWFWLRLLHNLTLSKEKTRRKTKAGYLAALVITLSMD